MNSNFSDRLSEPIRKLLEFNELDANSYQALDFTGERPMWKPEHRRAADRTDLRYPSDLSDGEWLIVEPMIPPAKRGGRRRSVNVRGCRTGSFTSCGPVANGKPYPRTCRPRARCMTILRLWNWDGTLERIHHELYVAVREQEGREPSPTVAIIDSDTAKGSQKGGLGSILRATTRARRSKVANGASWSTRWGSCLMLLFILPTFRIVMVLSICCAEPDDCSRSSNTFLLMADMPDARWHYRLAHRCLLGFAAMLPTLIRSHPLRIVGANSCRLICLPGTDDDAAGR